MRLFDDYGIEYVTRGKNTRRGEISIHCPYCSDEDPSQHLGVSLTGKGWGCLRDVTHRGIAPYLLVAAVLGCSANTAKMVVAQYNVPDPESLDDAITVLTGTPPQAEEPLGDPKLPAECRSITIEHTSTAGYWRYLKHRGFDDPDAVVWKYQLKCCTTGYWKNRIIIPVYVGGKLIGWQGRSIRHTFPTIPRYLSSSPAVKVSIFNYDAVQANTKSELLVITEGPFDAMKLDFYGCDTLRAVCTFGTVVTIGQIGVLATLIPKFAKAFVIFDQNAVYQGLQLCDWIKAIPASTLLRIWGAEDPGSLTASQVQSLAYQLEYW